MENASPILDKKPAITARSLDDEWYLKAYGIKESRDKYYGRRLLSSVTNLKNVSLAVLLGLGVGLGVAAIRTPRDARAPVPVRVEQQRLPESQATPVPPAAAPLAQVNAQQTFKRDAPAAAGSPAELERIKVRNRRLEALVTVLRQRKHTAEKRAAPDPSNLFGQ